jgi:hypothetical protein
MLAVPVVNVVVVLGTTVEVPSMVVCGHVLADKAEIDSENELVWEEVFNDVLSEKRLLLGISPGISCGTSGSNRSCVGDGSLLSCRLIKTCSVLGMLLYPSQWAPILSGDLCFHHRASQRFVVDQAVLVFVGIN